MHRPGRPGARPDRRRATRPSAGSATPRSSSTAPDGTPEGGVDRRPDRRGRGRRSCSPRFEAFIALGGAQQGITVHDETYNGTTITIVDLGRPSQARRAAGADACRRASPLPSGDVEIAYAVTDDVVVIGIGPGLRQARPRHDRRHLARRDTPLQEPRRPGRATAPASTFVDITAIRGLVEKALDPAHDPAALKSTRPTSSRSSSRSTRSSRRARSRATSTTSDVIITVK